MTHKDLLDLSHDPVVLVTPPPVGTPRRAENYHAALEWLIGRNQPFVVVTPADNDSDLEPDDEKKLRAIWFKNNAARLIEACRGFVYVEPDDARRAMWESRAQVMAKAFPVPMRFATGIAEAIALGCTLVAPGSR